MIAEALDANTRAFVRAHSDKNAAQPKPLKINRPGAPRRQRGTTVNELKAMMGKR